MQAVKPRHAPRGYLERWLSGAPREVVTVHVSEVTLHLNNSSSLGELIGDLIDDFVVDPRRVYRPTRYLLGYTTV
jgi:hypothetical protein